MESIKIVELEKEDLHEFLNYLNIHLAENGEAGMLFQPLSKEQVDVRENWEKKFSSGFDKSFGEIGWRKLWLARTAEGRIAGHIDIRAHNQLNSAHRVLLGMGVDINFRKLKIGQGMLAFVIAYCESHPGISWLDLEVLSNNLPAIKLYEKMGFQLLSNVKDMFRINNVSYDYTSMVLEVETKE